MHRPLAGALGLFATLVLNVMPVVPAPGLASGAVNSAGHSYSPTSVAVAWAACKCCRVLSRVVKRKRGILNTKSLVRNDTDSLYAHSAEG